ncbi:class I SAM-dependent methyltransferase [Leucobacter luti]|uniref:16S rRNA m(2)G 1207 methyltransferase n=1 Tax=Leucobacter luti TaxID=340320 RepID=A0A4V6MCG1_9MICO|nr:methyltransferase [Leucobacter luti]MBL3698462.1 methyltransferase domain-containing protein [Leucobacter luti]RZT64449.1 16S rRNA m(2)G 1207 methyltransferase [Leucobacter luti]
MTEHYFSEAPAGDFKPRTIEVELAGAPRRVTTAGGVFSPEHLDRGTEILLRTLAKAGDDRPGPLLDIGCGWGPIALAAALEFPEREVWAVDINERSRELTRANAAGLGLTGIRVAAPDEVPADVRFGEIRSNPPIRVGKDALHGILQQWLPRLAPGGVAHLVVAKHLGADSLQRWIGATFPDLAVDRMARDKGFHVIRAERPEA